MTRCKSPMRDRVNDHSQPHDGECAILTGLWVATLAISVRCSDVKRLTVPRAEFGWRRLPSGIESNRETRLEPLVAPARSRFVAPSGGMGGERWRTRWLCLRRLSQWLLPQQSAQSLSGSPWSTRSLRYVPLSIWDRGATIPSPLGD